MRARELMSTPVVTVRPEMPLKAVAEQMAAHRVSGVPVVDRFGHLVGMISESDVLVKLEFGRQGSGFSGFLDRLATRFNANPKRRARVASDLMTPRVITAGPEASLRELVHLMTAHDINRIPILEDGRVIGMVTRADIVRALARRDEAVTEEVRWRLQHDLWIDATDLVITTHNGIVTLAGMVENRSDAVIVERWTATTDGVVGVDAQDLRYRFDDRRVKAT